MHLKDKWDMFYIYLKFGQLISWKNDGLVEKFIKENTKAFSKNEKKRRRNSFIHIQDSILIYYPTSF